MHKDMGHEIERVGEAGSWAESLRAATEREEKKWGAILADLDLDGLHNWALLQLLDSCYPSPASENGRKACALLLGEVKRRISRDQLEQWEIDARGAIFARDVLRMFAAEVTT